MATIVLQADSTTLVLNGTILNDLAEGDSIAFTSVNPLTGHVNSARGGVTIKQRFDGGVTDMVVRVQKYSDSDVFLNSARNGGAPVVFNGSAKENYTKDGAEFVCTLQLENGSITTQPTDTRNNQDGNALMEYTIRFRNVVRTL
jgi:hypothetical protein